MSRAFLSLLGLLAILPVFHLQAQADLHDDLEPVRAEYHLPGLMAMVMKDGQIVAQGAAGVRKQGAAAPISVEDRINIGSCTKWMTATIAGRSSRSLIM